MPGTLRIASDRVNEPCSDIAACGITWMVCGVADSVVAYFGDSTRGSRPVTSSDSRTPRTSMVMVLPLRVAASAVPSSSASSAASMA